jgi:hypothetical protein
MITIGFSTREDNPKYQQYLQKTCMFKECQVIQKINNGDKSLSEVYNEILDESTNDIVVFVHDDLEFDTNNWGVKLMKLFERNPEQGIIGWHQILFRQRLLVDSTRFHVRCCKSQTRRKKMDKFLF